MKKTKKLVILGDSAFAEVAYECFTHDSSYEVLCFAVEAPYLKRKSLFGLPIIDVETLHEKYDSSSVAFYVAVTYTELNRLRTRLYNIAKSMGFCPASYVSSRAFVWQNVVIGEHCFIFEGNTLQPFVKIGDNVVMWSGNHIGHHSHIGDNCFLSSHVVVSGFCSIGANSFLGVNVSISNNLNIGEDNWVGPGVILSQDTDQNQLFRCELPDLSRVSPKRFFRVRS